MIQYSIRALKKRSGLTGDKFSFNEQGDGPVRYDVIHFRKIEETESYEWVRVGHYVAGKLTLQQEKIRFRSGEPEAPASVCSDPCPPGHARQPAAEGDRCCWRCVACSPYEVLRDGTHCEECLPGFLPSSERRDACVPVSERYLRPSSPWALAAMGVAIVGACATIFAGATFAKHADTPVVRAAGRELSYALLGGVLACYGVTFLLVQRPTDMICGAQNAAIGHAFSLVYGALWTKTNRIARIFREGKRSARRPGFISPRSQLAICGGLVGIQASVTAVLLAYIPARALRKHPTRDVTLLMCSEGLHALAFAYPSLLVAVCTVYAVLTRRVPGAFNESKHIGFSMYTTCVIWLAFVPIYVTTAQHAELRTAATALAVSLSASVILACLFAPKLYVILLRPERNVRPVLSAKAAQLNSIKMEPSAQSEDLTRKQRHHCDDGDRLRFAAPPLMTLGHRVSQPWVIVVEMLHSIITKYQRLHRPQTYLPSRPIHLGVQRSLGVLRWLKVPLGAGVVCLAYIQMKVRKREEPMILA
ncbi:GPRMGL5 [Cordylochernes scorpioides]|uniref:GPRMGL5 n=1 Tax=Cordylochernes scorpioides TaxID=51811 RepID=A0ABY6LDF7_9ARAC|nr:GPRMGL5 [Cordylochernes scorpioides]